MNHNKQIIEAIKDCLTVEIKFLYHASMDWDDLGVTRDIFLVALTNKISGKMYRTEFGQSLAESHKDNRPKHKPSVADVLYSIERYDPETFDDFCSNFGYNNDSIKAHKIYIEAQKQYYFMRSLPCIEKINEILQEY